MLFFHQTTAQEPLTFSSSWMKDAALGPRYFTRLESIAFLLSALSKHKEINLVPTCY